MRRLKSEDEDINKRAEQGDEREGWRVERQMIII